LGLSVIKRELTGVLNPLTSPTRGN
jgi:hypothetical protein